MKSRYFFCVAAIALIVGFWQLLAHQHHASNLAQAITAKDASGLDTAAEQAALKSYVGKHMGTGRTVILQDSFNRTQAAALAARSPESNGQVYVQAQASCASKADSITQARCVQSYVATHSSVGQNPQAVTPPNIKDYTKAYAAPGWTADSTGIALLIGMVAAGMGAYLFALRRW